MLSIATYIILLIVWYVNVLILILILLIYGNKDQSLTT